MAQIVSTPEVQGDVASPECGRQRWERPALRRLAANQAEGGGLPCNDGGGGAAALQKTTHDPSKFIAARFTIRAG